MHVLYKSNNKFIYTTKNEANKKRIKEPRLYTSRDVVNEPTNEWTYLRYIVAGGTTYILGLKT